MSNNDFSQENPRLRRLKELVHIEIMPILNAILVFLPHPIEKIKRVPAWTWKNIFIAQGLVTIGSGTLRSLARLWETQQIGGLFGGMLYSIVMGFVVAPIISITLITVTSFFFHYAFLLLTGTKPHFRTLHTVVFFSLIPFFILNIADDIFPVLKLFGLAFAGPLMVVGFVENLALNRRFVTKLVLGSLIALSVYIVFSMVKDSDWDFGNHTNSSNKAPEVELGK